MATDHSLPVNGGYHPQQSHSYGMVDQSYASLAATNSITEYGDGQGSSSSGSGGIRQDEVGWYFVEQYYTTMSRNPDKLFQFYNKRSQYICGVEAEKVPVSVGQKEINERIKALDIQDCKVRVSNVDSQGSHQNIVIQVIGEISTKGNPQKKFTQTFVLAEQPNGYYVLNDIFRYILEDEEHYEGEQSDQVPAESSSAYAESKPGVDAMQAPEPETLTNSADPAEREQDAAVVDKSLEEAIQDDAAVVHADPEAVAHVDAPQPAGISEAEDTSTATVNADEPEASVIDTTQKDDVPPSEEPAAPEPTPAASPPKPAAAEPAGPPKPAAPKTWASMVAGPKGIATAVPNASTNAASVAQPKSNAAPPSASTPPTLSTTGGTSSLDLEQSVTPVSSGSEWQTANYHEGKKQSKPQGVATPTENSRAYIKNVSENIDTATLRTVLNKIAEVSYLDINRQKNCAFVDFASAAGYQAAVAANPHEVEGERIYVEERRVRPQSFAGGYGPRGGMGRGGARGGADRPSGPGRGGFPKDGGQRGGFNNNRGGRGGVTPRGRGVQSAA